MENKDMIKVGAILQSYADTGYKYKVYFTDSLEGLHNERLLGEVNSYKDACKLINANLTWREPYSRVLMFPNATFIDFGSWTKFAAIIPPVSNAEIMGEN